MYQFPLIMKKYLLPCLFLLFPFALAAQQDAMSVYPDFYNNVKSVVSFVWDDHTNIATLDIDNENFDVVAVNDQMQMAWRSSFAGYVLKTARFKDKIVAIAATEHSTFKGAGNTYIAYLIDAATGKQLAQKEIYHGDENYVEIPEIFTGEGGFVKLCVRQTTFQRKMHVALPGIFALFSMGKYAREFNETRELDVITLDDKLNPATVKLPIASGSLVNWCANKQGDLFIAWFNGPSIEVYKYPAGSSSPAKQLNADVSFVPNDRTDVSEEFLMQPSSVHPDVVYYGTSYSTENENAELGIGKLDFAGGKKLFVTETFDRDHVKALEKSFVKINKKADDVDLGARKGLHIRYLAEVNGTVIATVTSRHFESSSYGSWDCENSVLVNGYDENLATRFQQILPANYKYPNRFLPVAYHIAKNKMYVISNEKSGLTTITGIYGCLDLASGTWEKMLALSKKHISDSDYSNGAAAMWFADSFAVAYIARKTLRPNSFDIVLQQNAY